MENNKKNIFSDKYKTNDLLVINMLFIGIYGTVIVFIANKLMLFCHETITLTLFIFAVFFFFISFVAHIFLSFLNRQINYKKGVLKNIRTINILYLSIIYSRIVFCIIMVPLQLALIFVLLKDILQTYFYIAISICSAVSAFSVAVGLYTYMKKRDYIKDLKKELYSTK